MSHNYKIAQRITTPIAIVTERGGIEWGNDAFEAAFGSDAKQWLKEAARAVAGERGWLQGFFLAADEQRTIDVDIEGRTYRVDKIMPIDEYDEPAVALLFEDVTRQREMEQAKSDFTAQIVHDLRGPLSGIQGTLEFVLSQVGVKLDGLLRSAHRGAARVGADDGPHQRNPRLLEDPVGKLRRGGGAGACGRAAQTSRAQPAERGRARRGLPPLRARP